MGRVEQPERADTMKAPGRDVLQEAPKEFVGGEGHRLPLLVTVVPVAKGHGVIIAGQDGLVGDRCLVHVTPEVLQDLLGALNDGFGEDDPSCFPESLREYEGGQGAPREVEEAPAEACRERFPGDQVAGAAARRGLPGAPVRSEATPGDEQVDMRMPLEGACPAVKGGEGPDLCAEEARIGAQGGERLERGLEEDGQERLLEPAGEPSQRDRAGRDDRRRVAPRDRGARRGAGTILPRSPAKLRERGDPPGAGGDDEELRVPERIRQEVLRAGRGRRRGPRRGTRRGPWGIARRTRPA